LSGNGKLAVDVWGVFGKTSLTKVQRCHYIDPVLEGEALPYIWRCRDPMELCIVEVHGRMLCDVVAYKTTFAAPTRATAMPAIMAG